MALMRTTNHEDIRRWVEEYNGRPAIVRETDAEEGDEVITVIFGPPTPNFRLVEWVEFFDVFESQRLRFHCHLGIKKEDAPHMFGFEGRDEPTDKSDETVLPDEVDDVDENMFPSSP